MPELVACPSCGCKIQLAEMFLGQRTRCIACSNLFVATPGLGAPPLSETDGYPLEASAPPKRVGPPAMETVGPSRYRLPLCPGCHRAVGWEAPGCPHCGMLLDPVDVDRRGEWARRRDAQPHRGKLIDTLGSFC